MPESGFEPPTYALRMRYLEIEALEHNTFSDSNRNIITYIITYFQLLEESSLLDELNDNVDIPPFLTKNKENVFGLRVKGESMIAALVGDGDLVLLEPITKPNNGDMVAAWLEDREEATLKHFYLEGNKVRLVPANSMMQPITVSASNVAVKGRVVGVMRTM